MWMILKRKFILFQQLLSMNIYDMEWFFWKNIYFNHFFACVHLYYLNGFSKRTLILFEQEIITNKNKQKRKKIKNEKW
jgi:hypothetical protein